MDDCGPHEAEFRRLVAALPEIGVLVNGAGDQTGDLGDFLGVGAEDEGKGGGEGGGGLHGGEAEFGNIVAGGQLVDFLVGRRGN